MSDWPRSLVIDDADHRWRVMVAPCDITDEKVIPPTFYPDPLFAWLWQASRDDRVSMAQRVGDKVAGKLLADWYRDHVPGLIEE